MKPFSLAILLLWSVGCSDDSNGSSCEELISFNVICPGALLQNETGFLTVDAYTAANINQLSIGAAGNGFVDPPAFQVPDPADASTTIPGPPFEFEFMATAVGDLQLTVTTFDLSEPGCSVSQICEFDILPPE